MGQPTQLADDNTVLLRGRLAAEPNVRTMPSGDQLCSFRLTVARPAGERARVDSIDCATTSGRVRRALGRAVTGDRVEVRGSLHRRFWRGPSGVASRYEVAVAAVRINARQRNGASPGRKPASA
jgi:single-strand DNA-binding protein